MCSLSCFSKTNIRKQKKNCEENGKWQNPRFGCFLHKTLKTFKTRKHDRDKKIEVICPSLFILPSPFLSASLPSLLSTSMSPFLKRRNLWFGPITIFSFFYWGFGGFCVFFRLLWMQRLYFWLWQFWFWLMVLMVVPTVEKNDFGSGVDGFGTDGQLWFWLMVVFCFFNLLVWVFFRPIHRDLSLFLICWGVFLLFLIWCYMLTMTGAGAVQCGDLCWCDVVTSGGDFDWQWWL